MGERWRRRNHHPNDENAGSFNPSHNFKRNHLNFHQSKGTENTATDNIRLGSHLVTAPGTNHISNTPLHPPLQRHNTHNRGWKPPFYHGQSSAPSYNQNKRFKQYLLRMISETHHEIALWFPDREDFESSNSGSEMDWQPEPEFIIPQPGGPIMYPLSSSPQPRLNTSNEATDDIFSHIPRKTFQTRNLGGFWGQPSGGDDEMQCYSMGVETQSEASMSGQSLAEWRESPILGSGPFGRSIMASEGNAVPLSSTRYGLSSGQAFVPQVKDWVINNESSRGVLYDVIN